MLTKQFSFRIDADLLKRYQNVYSNTLSLFLRKCIEKSLKDKNFFQSVYFGDFVLNNDKDEVK